MKYVALVVRDDEKSLAVAEEFRLALKAAGLEENKKRPEAVLSIGGDGTFLKAIRAFSRLPVMGIHTGTLGFLNDNAPQDREELVEALASNKFFVEDLATLEAKVIGPEGKSIRVWALNEVFVRERDDRTLRLEILINGRFTERYSGDRLIVCTPTGSTGLNLSYGGPVLPPHANVLAVTPGGATYNGAHTTLRAPFTLSMVDTLTLRFLGPGNMILRGDGFLAPMEDIQEVTLKANTAGVRILRIRPFDFWNRVTEKLLITKPR